MLTITLDFEQQKLSLSTDRGIDNIYLQERKWKSITLCFKEQKFNLSIDRGIDAIYLQERKRKSIRNSQKCYSLLITKLK